MSPTISDIPDKGLEGVRRFVTKEILLGRSLILGELSREIRNGGTSSASQEIAMSRDTSSQYDSHKRYIEPAEVNVLTRTRDPRQTRNNTTRNGRLPTTPNALLRLLRPVGKPRRNYAHHVPRPLDRQTEVDRAEGTTGGTKLL